MNTKYLKIISALVIALLVAFTSCIKDLNTIPLDTKITTSATVYKDATAYKQVLAKCYAGLSTSGQQGPSGNADISGIDEGFGEYLRGYWYAQELTTDEAVIGWNDQTIKDYHYQTWTAADGFQYALYSRIFYQISLCNEFIRESSDAKLSSRGITGADKTEVETYRAEARFLRALSYWHALDLYGNVPFVDENNAVGAFFPVQKTRAQLFTYLETELLDLVTNLKDARANEYGRADKAAAWMLLAKLYLNAKVYINTDKYTECLTYVNKVIASSYTLAPNYSYLFLADNNSNSAKNEVIFTVTYDGVHTQTWGGTTFIIHAAVGGAKMSPAAFGIDGGWSGTRTTSALVDKFTNPSDKRAMFFTDGQNKVINDVFTFTDGYAITKFKNVTSTGAAGSHPTYADTDFPVFRLADAYLMYAEAVKRGGTGGDLNTALTYINALRLRAYGDATGNLATTADITLDLILDERARELYWECSRRTDLVRFGRFSESTYVWPWKGGVAAGISTNSKFNLFPIPAPDLGANPNLKQNPGY
jgi:hypothetical protein